MVILAKANPRANNSVANTAPSNLMTTRQTDPIQFLAAVAWCPWNGSIAILETYIIAASCFASSSTPNFYLEFIHNPFVTFTIFFVAIAAAHGEPDSVRSCHHRPVTPLFNNLHSKTLIIIINFNATCHNPAVHTFISEESNYCIIRRVHQLRMSWFFLCPCPFPINVCLTYKKEDHLKILICGNRTLNRFRKIQQSSVVSLLLLIHYHRRFRFHRRCYCCHLRSLTPTQSLNRCCFRCYRFHYQMNRSRCHYRCRYRYRCCHLHHPRPRARARDVRQVPGSDRSGSRHAASVRDQCTTKQTRTNIEEKMNDLMRKQRKRRETNREVEFAFAVLA